MITVMLRLRAALARGSYMDRIISVVNTQLTMVMVPSAAGMEAGVDRNRMSNKPVDSYADKLAYRRLLRAGYSKRGIGKIVGISKQAMTRWEAIPAKYVRRISDATGISKADLRPSDFK